MNRYLEALNRLVTHANNDIHYPLKYLIDDANLLKELVRKEEKNRWHDLRKNPEDLPDFGIRRVLVAYKDNTEDFIFTNEALCTDGIFSEAGVIAWKYIEEFEDEKL